MLTAKLESALGHPAVDFADVQRPAGFAQHDSGCLWNAEIVETDVAGLLALLNFGDGGINVGSLEGGSIKSPGDSPLDDGTFGHRWQPRAWARGRRWHRAFDVGIA